MLEIDQITVSYGGSSPALTDLSLNVREGEIVALLGANGAGKSTTLRTISGLLRPQRGTVRYQGKVISNLSPAEITKLGISHSPEGRQVWPAMTVWEHLQLGAYLRTDRAGIEETRERMLELFPILKQRRDQLAGSMSGGEQQALAIARALMANPKLVLFDEPSLGLAPKLIQLTLDTIRRLRDEDGLTVVLVEQNAMAALKISDRAYVLEKGSVVLEGSAHELLHDEFVKDAYFGGLSSDK